VIFRIDNASADSIRTKLHFNYDQILGYKQSNIYSVNQFNNAPDVLDTFNHHFSYAVSLLPFEELIIKGIFDVPLIPTVMIGDTFTHQLYVDSVDFDRYRFNDTAYCIEPLRASYDPNIKIVEPALGDSGIIRKGDTVLNYTIYFQNTGNDTAFDVVVLDTLHENLDWNSFQLAGASDPVVVSFLDSNIVEFRFSNIYLPDSNVDEPNSHGVIYFSIHVKDSLPEFSQVTNSVGIYFDYNPPIITNTVLNTIVFTKIDSTNDTTGMHDFYARMSLKIYPNPNDGSRLFIEIEHLPITQIAIKDLQGKLVRKFFVEPNRKQVIDVSGLESGTYIVRAKGDDGELVKKLVITR
jgi:uncharacterized repeat protein (TIGR01451 family)